jgi:COMPASS component SPP1
MSFALSNLLNPEPAQQQQQQHHATDERRPSLPPPSYVQSPEQHYATPGQQYPSHGAAEALTALSSKTAQPTPWYGQDERRPSVSDRRSSSFGLGLELPPPTTSARKVSSPTLEQYQVASRSPEMRRPSVASPPQPGFTLPPLQGFGGQQVQEQARRPSVAHVNADTMQMPGKEGTAQKPAAHAAERTTSPHAQMAGAGPTSMPSKPAPSQSASTIAQPPADSTNSPPSIKQENLPTPHSTSPVEARPPPNQPADTDPAALQAMPLFKNSRQTASPLRDSSVPVPSTEATTEQNANSKKRPAPSKTKKGTATATKKAAAPPSKKRKVEATAKNRSETPASKTNALKAASTKGTPLNSSPAPSTRSYSAEPNGQDEEEVDEAEIDEDEDVEGTGELYCICRKPDNGTFMIGCDGTCDDWYHGKCVGIEERDKHLIDKYICPACTKAGFGKTSWKRMCRRHGCRQPAKVGKGKNQGSKYCSDECGVMYFREMVARTRNREDTVKNRASRRKGSIAERPSVEDDLGARGGVLAAGEVKSLLNTSKTAEDFNKLGEGVLSPPATPDGKDPNNLSNGDTSDYTGSESTALTHISTQKEEARRRHQLLKDRMKFVTMAKQAASRTATEKELKPKEYCGYDPRLEWTEAEFASWRDSAVGKQAFELETLAVENSGGGGDTDMTDGVFEEHAICDRKKCARHLEWAKLAVDSVRMEMSENSDRMRELEKEEMEIKERAALRRAGAGRDEGSVEVHGLGIEGLDGNGGGEAMEVDGPVKEPAVAEDGVGGPVGGAEGMEVENGTTTA